MVENFFKILVFCIAYTLEAQNLNIPDSNFKNALLDNASINTDHNSEISTAEASSLEYLNVSAKGIVSLEGVQGFVNLIALDCSDNEIDSLNLNANYKLMFLNCNNNSLRKLDVYENLNLQKINCVRNQLENLRLNVNIQSVDCSGNLLTNILFSKYNKLTSLVCNGNKTVNLELPYSIVELTCSMNQLINLNLSLLPKLTYVDCSHNQLTQIKVPHDLMRLDCSHNLLSSLDFSIFPKLFYLNCNYNQLKDIKVNNDLNYLLCSDNDFSVLDMSTVKNLSQLICTNNPKLGTICIPSIANLYTGSYHKDPDAVWSLCRVPELPIICKEHVTATGICEDFKDADESTAGIDEYTVVTDKTRWENGAPNIDEHAYMGMFWTEASNKNGFTAIKTRKGDGVLSYKITQKDSIYEPFMLVFGSYADGLTEKKLSVDLTNNKILSFDLKNLGDSTMSFFVQLEDIHGHSLVFDKYATTTGNPDFTQIGFDQYYGWSNEDYRYKYGRSTFSYDFANAICGSTEYVEDGEYSYTRNYPEPDSVFDYSKVVMVKFFPSGYLDYANRHSLIDQKIEISNFRLGDVDFVSSMQENIVKPASVIYKAYDLWGNLVSEGTEETLQLTKGGFYILKSGNTVKKRFIME